ncbi:MAG: hypothetical protein IJM64_00330 [Ottowia sp.]|nr:hypothetical protein [Ottowia sp.]MBQ6655711.1 hypothetical protein [Ottowia sp.]
MKKTLPVCFVAAAAALMLTACGGDDDTSNTGSGNTGGGAADTELMNAVLNIHNTERAKHGSPDLKWDSTLAQEANDYVQSALNAYSCSNPSAFDWNKWGWPTKVMDGTYGGNMVLTDNLTQAQSSAPLLDLANSFMNTQWLSGQPPYFDNSVVPSDPYFDGDKHHYRQMVWSATTTIGCAHARKECSSSPLYMLFCYYSPAGNKPGERALP